MSEGDSLRKRLEKHNERVDFDASMGSSRGPMQMKFSDRFLEDLEKLRVDPEQAEADNIAHEKRVRSMFNSAIKGDSEIVLHSSRTFLDHFLGRDGKVDYGMFHAVERRGNDPDAKVYHDFVRRGWLRGELSISILDVNDPDRIDSISLASIKSHKSAWSDHHREKSKSHTLLVAKLKRYPFPFDPMPGDELDWSWKEDIWEHSHKNLTNIHPHDFKDQELMDSLDEMKEILYKHHSIYHDQEYGQDEFIRDEQLIIQTKDDINELCQTSPDLSPDGIIEAIRPEGLGLNDIAAYVRRISRDHLGGEPKTMRFATLEESGQLHDQCELQLYDNGLPEGVDPWSVKMSRAMEMFGVDGPFGRYV